MSHQAINLNKVLDEASPGINAAARDGRRFSAVTIQTLTLKDAEVSSYTQSPGHDAFSLDYKTLAVGTP